MNEQEAVRLLLEHERIWKATLRERQPRKRTRSVEPRWGATLLFKARILLAKETLPSGRVCLVCVFCRTIAPLRDPYIKGRICPCGWAKAAVGSVWLERYLMLPVRKEARRRRSRQK
jgi:hypothetical protein